MQIQQVTIRAKARTLPERLGKVIIDFVIDMPRQLQGACRSVIVTPYLHKYGEAHALQDITIRGGLFSRVQQLSLIHIYANPRGRDYKTGRHASTDRGLRQKRAFRSPRLRLGRITS